MSLADVLKAPKLMLKECLCGVSIIFSGPFTSIVPLDWLNYLNEIENYVRRGLIHKSEKHLVIIYEYAIEVGLYRTLPHRSYRSCGMMRATQ